jgi:hypothetical protein
MFRALVILALATPAIAAADVDPRFAKLRDSADSLASLGAFLDKYVGDCGPISEGGSECAKNAEAFRKAANGHKFYMILTEDSTSVLAMGGFNPQGANGNPVLPFITFKGTLPDTWNVQMMQRQVQARQMRLQVVFTPSGLWELPKKGGGKIRGVKVKLEAVLVTVGRTGDHVALWLNK